MKRIVVCCIAVVVCLSVCCLPATADMDPYANIHINTGDPITDLIGVAKTQIGYLEGSLTGDVYTEPDGIQKYGAWYDEAVENIGAGKAAWEGSFVAWCANQADIPDTVIPPYAYCPYSVDWFESNGLFEASQSRGGTYIPKAGDLIYFAPVNSTLSSHMGIVTAVNGDYVYTIEGNTYAQSGEQTTQEVAEKKYMLNYIRIYGYATPQYELVFDITGDGQVSTSDARDLLLCVLNNSMQRKTNMDVDRNGEINTADARTLLIRVIQN